MAAPVSTVEIMRRSTRVRAELVLRVRSLDPAHPFDLVTRTVIVNAHGCGFQSKVEPPRDIAVELEVDGRTATARILNSTLIDADQNIYLTGVALDRPANFWGLASPPPDWAVLPISGSSTAKGHPFAKAKRPSPDPAPVVHPFARRVAQPSPPARPEPVPPVAATTVDAVTGPLRDLQRDPAPERNRAELSSDIADKIAKLSAEGRDAVRAEGEQVAGSVTKRIHETADAAASQVRAQLIGDFDRRHADLVQSSDELSARLSRQAEQAMAGLRVQVEQVSAASLAKLNAGLDAAQEQLETRAQAQASAFDARAGAAASTLQQKLNAALQQLDADIQRRQEQVARESAEAAKAAAEEHLSSFRAESDRQAQSVRQQIDTHAQRISDDLAVRQQKIEASGAALEARHQEISKDLENLPKLNAALQQLEADIQRRQQEVARESAEAEERLSSLRAESQRQAQSVREQIDTHAQRITDDLAARQQKIEASGAALEARHQAVAKDLDNLQQVRAYIESVLASLPDAARSHAKLQAAEAWEGLRTSSEKHIVDTLQTYTASSASRLREEIEAAGKQLRQEMAQHAEHTATRLQSALSEALADRQRQLAVELQTQAERSAADVAVQAERHRAMVNASEQRVREAVDRAVAELNGQAQLQAEAHRKQAESVHQDALKNLQEVSERSDRLLGETEATLLKVASEVVDDEVARARRELHDQAASESQAALASLREGSDRVVAAHFASAEEAARKAADVAASLQASHEDSLSRAKALQAQLDDAQRWLEAHTAEFQKTVHDAFLSAGGEIRGRVSSAVDTAEELIRQKSKDALARVNAAADQQATAMSRQIEATQARIASAQANAVDSAEKALQARLVQMLEVFRNDASHLAESTISRWQLAMDETLRAIPGMLQVRFAGTESDSASGGKADTKR